MADRKMITEGDLIKLHTAREWWGGDVEEINSMLDHAGKGAEGDYEHFFLTMALYHLEEAQRYINEIEQRAEARLLDDLIEDGQVEVEIIDGEIVSEKTEPKSDENLEQVITLVDEVIGEFPDKLVDYGNGVDGVIGFLVGEIVKRSGAKANPNTAIDVLTEKLDSVTV